MMTTVTTVCATCAEELPQAAAYCPSCGSAVPAPAPAASRATLLQPAPSTPGAPTAAAAPVARPDPRLMPRTVSGRFLLGVLAGVALIGIMAAGFLFTSTRGPDVSAPTAAGPVETGETGGDTDTATGGEGETNDGTGGATEPVGVGSDADAEADLREMLPDEVGTFKLDEVENWPSSIEAGAAAAFAATYSGNTGKAVFFLAAWSSVEEAEQERSDDRSFFEEKGAKLEKSGSLLDAQDNVAGAYFVVSATIDGVPAGVFGFSYGKTSGSIYAADAVTAEAFFDAWF